MTCPRVRLGAQTDGQIALRVSQPAYNVETNPPAPGSMYFDSTWPDVFPIHQTGIIAVSGYINTSNTNPTGVTASATFPDLGYVPVVDIMIKGTSWTGMDPTFYPGGLYYWTIPQFNALPYYAYYSGTTACDCLRTWVKRGVINVGYGLNNSGSGGAPDTATQIEVAYVVYRRQAFAS